MIRNDFSTHESRDFLEQNKSGDIRFTEIVRVPVKTLKRFNIGLHLNLLNVKKNASMQIGKSSCKETSISEKVVTIGLER